MMGNLPLPLRSKTEAQKEASKRPRKA